MTINRWFRHGLTVSVLTAAGATSWLNAQEAERSPSPTAILLTVSDAIGPATSDYIVHGIEHAETKGATLVVLELDTPGGLDTSMREIIQAILGSAVPVVTYVSPAGARAASAGTYILYASHVAAMAEATNTGAATPIAIGGSSPLGGTPTETPEEQEANGDPESPETRDSGPVDNTTGSATAAERKAVNDAVAYIRSLAEQRGRNADWAESAVRSGASISARAALADNVIDVVATDLADLLRQLDGREVEVDGRTLTLASGGLTLERFEAGWRTQLLAVISNPTLAYILMLVGIYGLLLEGYNPGAIVPGVVGSISLLLALFAFQVLPVDYAGLALIALGVILMIAEFLVPSFGALGIGGIAAFVFGSVILIDTDIPGYGVSRSLIASIASVGGASLLGIIWLAMKARARPVVSGAEELAVTFAEALEDFDGDGAVWAHGERWRAHSDRPIKKGQKLKIRRVEGLLLHVEPT